MPSRSIAHDGRRGTRLGTTDVKEDRGAALLRSRLDRYNAVDNLLAVLLLIAEPNLLPGANPSSCRWSVAHTSRSRSSMTIRFRVRSTTRICPTISVGGVTRLVPLAQTKVGSHHDPTSSSRTNTILLPMATSPGGAGGPSVIEAWRPRGTSGRVI